MSSKRLIAILLTTFIILLESSCELWIDPDVNVDPNKVTDVQMELLVPSIQANMAYQIGGNNSVRIVGIWTQYFRSNSGRWMDDYDAKDNSITCDTLWSNIYAQIGKDIKILIKKSSEKSENGEPKSVYTRGMAKVLMAELLGFSTNLWGDIPCSEAFQGVNGSLMPKLDSQEEIYLEIDKLLSDAISDLSEEKSVINIKGDLIFSGDKDKWLATAYALRGRYALILSNINSDAYNNAIIYINKAFENGFDGFVFDDFSDEAENPLSQYLYQRSGDLVMCSTFIDFLVTDSDPRLLEFSSYDKGGDPGTLFGEASIPGNYILLPEAKVYLMNLAEAYFILAEGYLQTSKPDLAFEAFNNGVLASIKDVNVTGTPLNLPTGASSLTLENIIYQKYIANFGTVQGFNDWRRTGLPNLKNNPVSPYLNQIPRRFMYPQEEVRFNTNVSNEGISLTDRVWWDVE